MAMQHPLLDNHQLIVSDVGCHRLMTLLQVRILSNLDGSH